MKPLVDERHFPAIAATAETAIRRNQELLRWWAGPRPRLVDLKVDTPGARVQAFYEDLPLEGRMITGMGCWQASSFRRRTTASGQPPQSLREWVLERFLKECHHPGPDGKPSGFRYRPILVRDAGFSPSAPARPVTPDTSVRLADVGTRYEWVVLYMDLLDYMRAFPLPTRIGLWMRRLKHEAGLVVLHPAFFHWPHPSLPGAVEEVSFGYAVVPHEVKPTLLAYVPGRWYAAFKQYRASLLEDGSVTIEVLFIVTPRPQKILNVFGRDPVYGALSVVDTLTLRRTAIDRWVRRTIEQYAMGHHGRVHINMLNGMREFWEGCNWQAGRSARAQQ